jgi:hypothetical protein
MMIDRLSWHVESMREIISDYKILVLKLGRQKPLVKTRLSRDYDINTVFD